MKIATKLLGIVLSVALVLSCVFVPGFNAFATTPTAVETYAVNELGATIGEQLLYEPFNSGDMSGSVTNSLAEMTNTAVSGWRFVSETSYQSYYDSNNPGKFKIASGRINVWSYGSDAIVVLPDLDASNYIFSVSLKGGVKGKAGLITDINGNITEVAKTRRFGVSFTTGNVITGSFTQYDSNSSLAVDFTVNENHSSAECLKLSVVSFKGNNYYFIDEEFVGTSTKYEADDERIAFYIGNADIYFDDITVTALNAAVVLTPEEKISKYAQEELGATVGEELLKETFTKSDMGSSVEVSTVATIDNTYTDVAGWQYVGKGGAIWAVNAPKYKIASGRINFWCSYGESMLAIPDVGTSDYIVTAKIRRGGSTTASAKVGIATDIEGDATTTTKSKRFGLVFNAGTSPYSVANAYTQIGTNGDTATNFTLDNTYTLDDYVTLGVVSYEGNNYYFVDGNFVTSVEKYAIENERIGFYLTTTDIYLDDVVVTELIAPAAPKSEEELLLEELGATVGEELINEPFEKGSMSAKIVSNGEVLDVSSDYTNAPGWKMTNTSDILWTAHEGQLKIANGRTNFWCYYGNAAFVLPDVDTSNYIFTVKVMRGGGGEDDAEFGFMTDIDGDIASASVLKRFGVRYSAKTTKTDYPVEYFVTKTAPYNSAEEIHDAPEGKYFLNDYITLKVISFGGTNYYFVNGNYILSLEKNDIADERLAFYVRSGDFYLDDVSVTKLEYNFESELADVYGMNAIKVGEAEDNQTYKVNFDYIAENNFSVGFFTADENNANSVGYAEGKDIAVYNVEVKNDILKTATTYVTVDKKGATDDAVGTDLYMYVIGDANGVEIANATAEKLTNVKGDNALLSNDGAAMLKDVAENESQALRYFFNYDTVNGNDIVIDGEVYTVKSRGFLLANGDVLGTEQITRTTAVNANVIDYNVKNLGNCWNYAANGDALDSSELCYSIYVTGFNAVNGSYNNTKRLYAKGYIVVEIDGVEYTFYSAEVNMTVSEVANLVK